MIKRKEDLLNTCIENDKGELLKVYLGKCKEYGIKWGGVSLADLDSFIPTSRSVYVDNFGILYQAPIPCVKTLTKLTLADFEEGGEECIEPESVIFAPENKQRVSKYKYTPIEVESVFDLKEHLENGKLFYGKPDNMKKIMHEWGLMKVIVEDEFRIHLQEEVRWQEQISEEFNFTYVEKEDSFVQTGCTSSEDVIKFAKRVLELSGELK